MAKNNVEYELAKNKMELRDRFTVCMEKLECLSILPENFDYAGRSLSGSIAQGYTSLMADLSDELLQIAKEADLA